MASSLSTSLSNSFFTDPFLVFGFSQLLLFSLSPSKTRLNPARSFGVAHSTRRNKMGKVHGSLARAGKVRGQTPKVAKQDKKKLPKGRAIKRLKVRQIPATMISRV